MTSSRNSSFFRAVVSAFVALTVPALAVEGAPSNPVAPPSAPAAVGQKKPAFQAGTPAPGGPAAPVPASPGTPVPEAVQSQPLELPEGQLLGLLDSASGGLGRELWAGSDRQVIEILLARLPAAQGSPALTSLARRLLLSRADPPENTRATLLAPRLEGALAIGDLGAIEQLAQQAQPELLRPEVLGPRVDALLYQGKDTDACALAERARGRSAETAWTKRLAYCDAVSGKVAQARLGVDVLSDSGDADAPFATLMNRVLDKGKPASVTIDNPSAVHFALLRKTGSAIADATLERASPGFLAAWSRLEKAPILQRAAAAERAASSAALPAGELVKLYRAVPMKAERLNAKFTGKRLLSGADGAAYAVQRMALAKDENERALLAIAALRNARDRGVLPAVAAALRGDVAAFVPSEALVDEAVWFATAEALGGTSSARRWLDLLRAKGQGVSEPALALRSLLAARFGGDHSPAADQMLSRLRAARPADQARANLEWTLLRPFGLQQSNAIFLQRLQGPSSMTGAAPSLAVLEGLQAASEEGHRGETVAYALLALGPGPRAAHPLALAATVRALAKVGLEADARAIAGEALAWRMP